MQIKNESAVNKIFINKIELNKKINGDVDILKIVDKGKVKLKEIGDLFGHLQIINIVIIK